MADDDSAAINSIMLNLKKKHNLNYEGDKNNDEENAQGEEDNLYQDTEILENESLLNNAFQTPNASQTLNASKTPENANKVNSISDKVSTLITQSNASGIDFEQEDSDGFNDEDFTIDSDINEEIENIIENHKYDEYDLNKVLDKDYSVKKTIFGTHLRCKLSKINQRMRYADNKYYDIRRDYTMFGLTVLIISFILTLVEAFLNTVELDDIENQTLKNFVKLIPLILSTLVSFFTALIKFYKYEEKIESLVKAIEKCLFSIAEIKEVRESLYFCENKKDIKILINKFQKTIYPKYLSNNSDIEQLLTDNDYSKYVKMVNRRDLEHLKINKIKERISEIINTEGNEYNDKSKSIEQLESILTEMESTDYKCGCI